MFKTGILPILAVAIFAIAGNAQITVTRCTTNEFFTTCGTCEATCDNRSPVCDRACRPAGCFCRTGFVRHNGQCISPSRCPSGVNVVDRACGANEIYMTCGTCEGTCNNLNPVCDRMCRPAGCYCNSGSVRQNGRCIPISQCWNTVNVVDNNPWARTGRSVVKRYAAAGIMPNQVCRTNERYTTCGPCEPQCGQPNAACTLQCRPAGCYCFNGFSRRANGDCVRDADC
uniref:TIL domain-containing protein n=1 Tax=Panagrellus redivivus TaxID=6233 RepID=A0A7E4VF88_PANRE